MWIGLRPIRRWEGKLRDPDRLGKYRIDGIIGEGGMGVIYRGYDEDLEQAVGAE